MVLQQQKGKKMAILWKNERQLKIIKMSWREYAAATDSWALCSCCGDNSSEEPLYYVALVGDVYCQRCFDAYLKEAKRYKSDFEKEQNNFIKMRNKLIDLGVWDGGNC